MSKRKFHDFDEGDEWLERLLDEYIHNRLPEVPIEEEEVPSAEFCHKMEKLIENPHKWKKYMYTEHRRIQRLEAIRITAFVTVAIAFFILAVQQFDPVRSTAFIPIFVLEQANSLSDIVVLKPNPDANPLSLPLEEDSIKFPEFVMGYVPSDFVYDSTSDRAENHKEKYISQSKEAVFYIAIGIFSDELTVYLDSGYAMEQIVVGNKDVTKLTGYDSCIYLWKEGNNLLRLYSYQADEKEMEQVIKEISLVEQ